MQVSINKTKEGDLETAKPGIACTRQRYREKMGTQETMRAIKVSERHLRDVDSENGETQSMVPNNVVSWYII